MAARAKTFLLCHGAWSGGWAWKKMHPLMRRPAIAWWRRPTPVSASARISPIPSIDLETHIQDILNVIKYEDLSDIVLLGHTYGGMVATGVADRARERVDAIDLSRAFVPRDGQSLFDLNEAGREPMRRRCRPATAGACRRTRRRRIRRRPISTGSTRAASTCRSNVSRRKLKLQHGEPAMPRSYIYCKRIRRAMCSGSSRSAPKSEAGWRYFEIDASHAPNVTAPEALMACWRRSWRSVSSFRGSRSENPDHHPPNCARWIPVRAAHAPE